MIPRSRFLKLPSDIEFRKSASIEATIASFGVAIDRMRTPKVFNNKAQGK